MSYGTRCLELGQSSMYMHGNSNSTHLCVLWSYLFKVDSNLCACFLGINLSHMSKIRSYLISSCSIIIIIMMISYAANILED